MLRQLKEALLNAVIQIFEPQSGAHHIHSSVSETGDVIIFAFSQLHSCLQQLMDQLVE